MFSMLGKLICQNRVCVFLVTYEEGKGKGRWPVLLLLRNISDLCWVQNNLYMFTCSTEPFTSYPLSQWPYEDQKHTTAQPQEEKTQTPVFSSKDKALTLWQNCTQLQLYSFFQHAHYELNALSMMLIPSVAAKQAEHHTNTPLKHPSFPASSCKLGEIYNHFKFNSRDFLSNFCETFFFPL